MVCLVGVKTGRMKNRERKIGWRIAFFTVWFREKTRETKNKEKNFLSRPTFFYLPNLRGKWGGKSAE